jgi:superfamily I DNA/RNA helicase
MSEIARILDFATGAQRHATTPGSSAWVEANAGTGKTKVLTDRVTRLLLAGVRPERILCLTFTKAAAAEMRNRLASSASPSPRPRPPRCATASRPSSGAGRWPMPPSSTRGWPS